MITLGVILLVIGTFAIFFGVCSLADKTNIGKKIIVCLIGLLCVVIGICLATWDYTPARDGFIGSDGKYYEYIPEFGDDVNNWMEENW